MMATVTVMTDHDFLVEQRSEDVWANGQEKGGRSNGP